MRFLLHAVAGASLMLAGASPAAAQFATTFDQLVDVTKPGQTLFVIDRDGYETRGRLERVADGTLTLTSKTGARRFTTDDVVVIRTPGHDSVLNGALIGGALEAGVAGVAMLSCGRVCDGAAAAVIGNFVIGAGLGALIDAFILTPRDVYRVGQHRVDVQPIVTGTRHGAQLVLRW
jgi:hypothetical protein